jgi:rhomboid family GlyGly-CTERM serine protease
LRALPAAVRATPLPWRLLSVSLGVLAMLGWGIEPGILDWQRALLTTQPWRLFSAVGVHYSPAHLLLNLAGLAGVAALGAVARIDSALAWAWVAAWPLTQLGLLLDPGLVHYGGLSGVLHAGVVIVAIHLLRGAASRGRRIGAAILLGLALKVGLEFPWSPPAWHAALQIMVTPLAHVSGLVAGLVCGGAVHLLARRKSSRHDA